MTNRRKPFQWPQPDHTPIERARERIDGGFVLVGGWQVKYEPTPEHRAILTSTEYRVRVANEALDRAAQRREDAKASQQAG